MRLPLAAIFLRPATEVCEGYVFTHVCQSFCSLGGGGLSRPTPIGMLRGLAGGGVSRATPRGKFEGSGGGRCLQAQTRGFEVGVWPGGVSRSTLWGRGCPGPHPGWLPRSRPRRGSSPSMHWGSAPPPLQQMATAVGGMHPYWNAFLLWLIFTGPGGGGRHGPSALHAWIRYCKRWRRLEIYVPSFWTGCHIKFS